MDQYQRLLYNQFVEYNSCINVKENYIVRLTYSTIIGLNKEDFLVWIKKIDDTYITGIVVNNLQTKEFEIGNEIIFTKKHIKQIHENKVCSLNNSFISIQRVKNNPFTIYFQSLNKQFI